MERKPFNLPISKKLRKVLRSEMPRAEVILWSCLRGSKFKDYKFRRQFGVGEYVLDFYCPRIKLGIEIDGDSHFDSESQVKDVTRQKFIESQGIKISRFTNLEIYQNLDAVLEILGSFLP